MSLLTLTRPIAAPPDHDDEGPACISCRCRPAVTYCGRYDDSPASVEEVDEEKDCRECVRVWTELGCPNCGCFSYQECDLCREKP